MDILIVTNNNKVYESYKGKTDVLYLKDGSYIKVLEQARDLIHLGARLISDPMAGNIRPNQTPYKSLLLEGLIDSGSNAADAPDYDSLRQIESSIGMARLYQDISKTPEWSPAIREDFMTVDLSLLGSAIH